MKKTSGRKIAIAIAITVLVLAGIGAVLTNNKKKNEAKTSVVAVTSSAVAVRTALAQLQPVDLDFAANGNFAPSQQLNFSAENSGRVVRVLVDEGSRVSKGQTLAIINTNTLNIDLETAQAAYSNALRDRERYQNAFQTGGVTRQQLDQANLALENARARVAQAKIRVGDANIKSSINGIVNKRYIEPGAVVAPGTQLFELVDVSRLKLKVNVNEAQVAQLRTGTQVTIKASAYPDRDFTGKVSFIAPKADNSLNFPVEIELVNTGGDLLKAGMYGTALFNFPNQTPSLVIPRAAFVGGVNSNQVFVMDGAKTARLRKVVAGRIFGEAVEILQGLEEGETVITSGQINLSDGSKLSPIK
ncbi:MAG: efflux RND transporter periplasmic adaptor subunit [Sphingobacteriales bacterium]|nr:MAG: efflux RND transporter periplasmic adaptor subunit [Sphingobacteriales bacterium]